MAPFLNEAVDGGTEGHEGRYCKHSGARVSKQPSHQQDGTNGEEILALQPTSTTKMMTHKWLTGLPIWEFPVFDVSKDALPWLAPECINMWLASYHLAGRASLSTTTSSA